MGQPGVGVTPKTRSETSLFSRREGGVDGAGCNLRFAHADEQVASACHVVFARRNQDWENHEVSFSS